MKKICLIIPSLQCGGMERVMSELISYFAMRKEVKVRLILYGKKRKIFFSLPDNIKIYKPNFLFSDYPRMISSLKTLFFIRKTVKKINPDTILSFGEYWNNFVLLSLLGLKFPVFVSDRCQPDKSLGKFHDQLRKWLYPTASGIIAQTIMAKKIYKHQNLNNNIRVIGNPIYQISLNGELERKENIILTVGRLIESKHHDRLIKIFKQISLLGWKLVIVGGDALKQTGMKKLKILIKKLDMEDKVELTGAVSDIASYYHKSKIFAFTSSSEGFPNVIGEAMSAGLPVIAYDCVAGPSDLVVDGETGFLVSTFKDIEYAKKLELLAKDVNLRERMGSNGRERVNKFKVDNVAEEFYWFILPSE